jgi:quercetin dioxygenase-like cupin family protein
MARFYHLIDLYQLQHSLMGLELLSEESIATLRRYDMAEKKGVATGEKLNLANLAGYQEGAVVSRTVVDKPVGTITAFAFDAGEGLSEHTAPYDAFVQVLDGEAEINIEGKVQTVCAGEIVVMPAGKPHSLRAVNRFKMLLVMIRA